MGLRAKPLRLIGQRWKHRVGNSIVLVDNAFSWSGWGQERLIVNDETVGSAGGWFGLFQSFRKNWLTRFGEGELKVALSSRLKGIACELTVDGEPVLTEAFWEAAWSGARGAWPDETAWQEAAKRGWFAR